MKGPVEQFNVNIKLAHCWWWSAIVTMIRLHCWFLAPDHEKQGLPSHKKQ